MNHSTLSLALVLSVIGCIALADVTDSPSERRLSLSGSQIGIAIPREDWVFSREQRRPGDTAVYYMLTSARRQMIFSIFVDRTDVCQNADVCLDAALKNTQYKDAKDLQKSQEGPFRVATFYLDQPLGAPIKQAHVLASAYVDGQWFDVHISKSDKERPDLGSLMEFLRVVALK
jgi:hypothetical protein